MKIKPMDNHILLTIDDVEEITSSGIIVTAGEDDGRMPTGTVQAIGPRVNQRETDGDMTHNDGETLIMVGDRVMFNGGIGPVRSEGKEYAMIKRCHVVAVIEG